MLVLLLFGVVRPIGQETTTVEKIVHYSQFPREETCHFWWGSGGTWGSTGVNQVAEGARGKHGQEPSLWSPQEAMGKVG